MGLDQSIGRKPLLNFLETRQHAARSFPPKYGPTSATPFAQFHSNFLFFRASSLVKPLVVKPSIACSKVGSDILKDLKLDAVDL